MSDFIYFEDNEDNKEIDNAILNLNEEMEESMIIDSDNDNLIIDENLQENDSPIFYRFHNQTTDTSEVIEQILREEESTSKLLEANNYITENEIEEIANEVYDETDDFLKSKTKFINSLLNPIDQTAEENTFYLTLLHAIRYAKSNKSDLCLEEDIEKEIGVNLYSAINSIKDSCILDLNLKHFEEMCYNLNDILLKENMFLRIYEIKDKFRYLFHENKDSKNCLRSLSSCIKEKFNSFGWAELKLSAKEKTDLIPINILYKPVKKLDNFIKCYFVKDLKYAYRSVYEKTQKEFGVNTLYECYYCNDFWIIKSKYERHLKVCGKKPGVIYDFTLKNIVTFEDNFKYYGDLPFSVYADFETTAPTQSHLNPEEKEMFAVSYSLIFAWHSKLNLPRQMVARGYNHTLEKLSNLNYLTKEQLALRNQMTTHQLKDCIVNVNSKRKKNALVEMFNVELKFACDILMAWFKRKIQKSVVNNEHSVIFKRFNPITLNTQCSICSFPLSVDAKGLEFKQNQMSYLNFLIRKEYAFIKNIYDKDELKISEPLSSLEKYWQTMKRYIIMIKTAEIDLQSVYYFCEIENENLKNILYEYLGAYEDNVLDLITLIKKFKVSYEPHHNISKYTLQIYSFFYDRIMSFPTTKFDEIKTVSTSGFIKNLYRIINCKVHIHHSHVTGKIIGYSHDFCNWKIRENNYIIPLIGHNFLGFDIYYMVKGFRPSVWETSDLKMGGTTLTNINYASTSNQIKVIDTMKYYQTSLANIANTATFNEKVNIENTVVKFLERHSYFSK